MIRTIIILTDYKGFFGSKQKSNIYRGGMDIKLIISLFNKFGYSTKVMSICNLEESVLKENNPIVLYTSSEDYFNLYKSYIEDVIYHLEEIGVYVLPCFSYLKAHNNKVAMELLRTRSKMEFIKTIQSKVFGTIEELKNSSSSIQYPIVLKPSSGAMSRGVNKAENKEELIRNARNISKSIFIWKDIKEFLRQFKYKKKYIRESKHRNKFVIQNLIPNLNNDWKVLVYGNKCYALYRKNRKNDFRASGSGLFEFKKEIPEGMLDYALNIRKGFNVPNISLDIGFDGIKFHLIEFQFLYFGTTTLEKSKFYFEKIDSKWLIKEEKTSLEEAYVNSIINFITEKN